MSRVSTYLNFPGTTEAAFQFYKTVFGTEYEGEIMRFGEVPSPDPTHPIAEKDKNLIMHIALPILGGHVLMGTDVPESMGFTLTPGNHMHINVEPSTREETTRLFTALSAGGKTAMPLQEMFWGGYFGSCTDKFGINWMFNYQAPKES